MSMGPSPGVGGDSDVKTLYSSLSVARGENISPENSKQIPEAPFVSLPPTRTVRKSRIFMESYK